MYAYFTSENIIFPDKDWGWLWPL